MIDETPGSQVVMCEVLNFEEIFRFLREECSSLFGSVGWRFETFSTLTSIKCRLLSRARPASPSLHNKIAELSSVVDFLCVISESEEKNVSHRMTKIALFAREKTPQKSSKATRRLRSL